ncbi:hypothetical protein O0I10_000868 [Lichtheimia ornata]|uniref:Cell division control protein 45 n=1 Tax=Lichtheimia ornata TaxID=688661 RepID=A0AAD7Y4G3_9FUNG|nr:uncharacterized protein O0I10_000868 [Lichtheimia ornata]KAJ8663622.1 hypothetical protein O0I10_000868 [Lichtheimia ornata]
MVRITEADFDKEYERIKQDSVEGNCIIFVASDVDAICACKIFQFVLKSDLIQHKLVPVSGYQDLEKANNELVANDPELRSIIMINCGSSLELYDFFQKNEDLRIYVFDSHRPINLHNCLPANQNVRVFDEAADTERMNQHIEAYDASLVDDSSDDDSMDGSDTDEEDDLDLRPRQRRRLNQEGHSRGEQRRLRQRQRRLLAEYHMAGVYYGNSVAGQMYTLATQLAKTNNELLWLAIIGVTAQYIFERIDTDQYMKYVQAFNDNVALFNMAPDEENMRTGENSIQKEEEYRFMLFRHWSLYDSMYHSGYVASKLSVWRDYGRRRLNNMFAKMGFSLAQCQQVYTHMDLQLKDMLRHKIETVAPLYGLTDICFPSFARTYGWKLRFSASDAVYALATLLETSPLTATRLGENVKWNQDEDWDALESESGDHGDNTDLSSVRRKWWMRNFYTAYDATNNVEGLQHGIDLCMKIQKAVVRQGTAILDKKASKVIKNFRVVIMRDGPDLPLFQHPLTLSKLALFLTDAYREHASRSMPFVISSLDEEHDSYLVVANTGAPSFGDIRKNPFGLAFKKAANKSKARISFDTFESSVLQIHKNDLDHFLENLFIGA